MTIRLPPDIEALVVARVSSGEFSSPEEVLRSAMAPWVARELQREGAMASIRAKIDEGDADQRDFTAAEIGAHLDAVAASLSRADPDAA